ncbi:hypothetical protein HKX48_005822 [Thoreauomyces humboldtii]|nr:hypothetical protein HKX48_005822 [Thoreauomyces humboldtii]
MLKQLVENQRATSSDVISWPAVIEQLDRSSTACNAKWAAMEAIKDGPWTPKEHELLKTEVAKHLQSGSRIDWKVIGQRLGRARTYAYMHWRRTLDPNLGNGAAIPEEDKLISSSDGNTAALGQQSSRSTDQEHFHRQVFLAPATRKVARSSKTKAPQRPAFTGDNPHFIPRGTFKTFRAPRKYSEERGFSSRASSSSWRCRIGLTGKQSPWFFVDHVASA